MPVLFRDGKEYDQIVVLMAEGFGEMVSRLARLAIDDWSDRGQSITTLFVVTGRKSLPEPIAEKTVTLWSNHDSVDSRRPVLAEFEISAFWLELYGIQPHQIICKSDSNNTPEQMINIKNLIPTIFQGYPKADQFQWVFVAHDLHLPRVVWLAHRASFPVSRALGASFWPRFEWINRQLPWFWLPRWCYRELELAASRRDRDLGYLSNDDYQEIVGKKYPQGIEVIIR